MQTISRLIELMKTLRDPERGCPWDREQTARSILPHTLEEAYELADAIEREDLRGQCEELGDLLFHVVFYSQIASEARAFEFTDVVEQVVDKLRHRHPHVFGEAKIETAAEQSRAWERLKAGERRAAGKGILADVPQSLPAMRRALKMQERAARAGFDWDRPEPVLEKLEEEIAELREARRAGADAAVLESELGDILFAAVNCARHLGVDPELALRSSNEKFMRRFSRIESELAARGKTPEQATLEEMEQIWQDAKHDDRG